MLATRCRVEERRVFTREEKETILNKSKSRCSHCGKKISIGGGFTVEHVIPLSKGGSNNIRNLVPLCKQCNEEKSDDVIVPSQYYRYLSIKSMKILNEDYDKYLEEKNWISYDSIFSEDTFEVPYTYYFGNKITRNVDTVKSIPVKKVLRKVKYKDLDEVLDFVHRYNTKYVGNCSREDVKGVVSEHFLHGCMYMSKNKKGEINFLISLGVDEANWGSEDESVKEKIRIGELNKYSINTIVLIDDTFTKADNLENVMAVKDLLLNVMNKIITYNRSLFAIVLRLTITTNNVVLKRAVNCLFGSYGEEEDNITMHKDGLFGFVDVNIANKKLRKIRNSGNAQLIEIKEREATRKATKILKYCVDREKEDLERMGIKE